MNPFNDVPLMLELPDNTLPDPDRHQYYSDLENRTLWIEGEIGGDLFLYSKHILRWNKEDQGLPEHERQPIKIFIDSPGGSLDDMLAFVGLMKISKTPIWTIVAGTAYSAAACVLMAGHQRFALPNSEIMIHQPLGGTQGQATDIEIHAKRILKMKDKLNSMLADATGQPLEVIKRDTERDNFMSADEACEYGLIDKVLKTR